MKMCFLKNMCLVRTLTVEKEEEDKIFIVVGFYSDQSETESEPEKRIESQSINFRQSVSSQVVRFPVRSSHAKRPRRKTNKRTIDIDIIPQYQ